MWAIVARNLGKKLDTAASTIFTHFNSVEDIRQAVVDVARELYNGYVEDGLKMVPPMKGFGVQYIRFAMEESNLYAILFMNKRDDFRENYRRAVRNMFMMQSRKDIYQIGESTYLKK